MKTYARIENSVVVEVIQPFAGDDGVEVPIDGRFPAELVLQMVDVTGLSPMPDQQWTYDGSVFAAPVPYQPSSEEIKATNTGIRDALLSIATLAIGPLQDAVDLDDATPAETALLKLWKQYRVAVNRIDLTLSAPAWPVAPA